MAKAKGNSIEVLPANGPGLLNTAKQLARLEQLFNHAYPVGGSDFDGEYSSGTDITPAENAHLDAVVKFMNQQKMAQEKRDRAIGTRIGNWVHNIGRRIRWP